MELKDPTTSAISTNRYQMQPRHLIAQARAGPEWTNV